MSRCLCAVILSASISCWCGNANASIMKGSLTFDDNAFADAARMIVGDIGSFFGGATNVNDALTGPSLATGFGIGEFDRDEIVELSFLDNFIVNAPGPDLVVYEGSAANGFDVAIDLGGGVFSNFVHFEPVSQGFSEGGTIPERCADRLGKRFWAIGRRDH